MPDKILRHNKVPFAFALATPRARRADPACDIAASDVPTPDSRHQPDTSGWRCRPGPAAPPDGLKLHKVSPAPVQCAHPMVPAIVLTEPAIAAIALRSALDSGLTSAS